MKKFFAASLALLALGTPAFGDAYPRAGWTADLSTLAHGVDGIVTIVDADTVQVDHFFYDGRGVSVYFYLATANNTNAFKVGQRIGPQLLGTAYSDGSLTIDLPAGLTLDGQNAISVWCEVADANFGSGSFVAPPPPMCPADFDHDGDVDLSDLGVVLADFGCTGTCSGDVDGDNDTDLSDLGEVLSAYGLPCQ